MRIGRRKATCRLLIDCEATGPILREEWVRNNEILVKKHQKPIEIQNVSQQPILGVDIYYRQPLELAIRKHPKCLV